MSLLSGPWHSQSPPGEHTSPSQSSCSLASLSPRVTTALFRGGGRDPHSRVIQSPLSTPHTCCLGLHFLRMIPALAKGIRGDRVRVLHLSATLLLTAVTEATCYREGTGEGPGQQGQEISWAATMGEGGKLATRYGNRADKDRARNRLTG